MKEELKLIFSKIADVIYPKDITCIFCGDEVRNSEYVLCDKCQKTLPWNTHFCKTCGSPIHSDSEYCLFCKENKKCFENARATFIYAGDLVRVIHDYKYNGKKYLAEHFAKMMVGTYKEMEEEFGKFDFIVPVPLHKNRLKKRGYNQSELLAEELSKRVDIPVSKNNLVRIKDTQTQTDLSFKERQDNLNDAFMILNEKEYKNKKILLIDDVLTTGSTSNHCASVLKKVRAKTFVLTLASTSVD